ncbi:uncharacterized protein LOC132546076 [Ylistrum balloti]|uniref:uncharacterized protein LOC132546076 n=1 Tax=Ylistrum balloti TaxID=509963 RepID=UPI002905A321|nr:uncharacterized protein LOC132546076 [Ylistrum balloti]
MASSSTEESGCSHHHGVQFLYVCSDCGEELVCQECRHDLHQGHNLTDVSDVIPRKREIIRQYIDELSSTGRQSNDSAGDTEDKLQENRSSFESLRTSIRRQGEAMKGVVEAVVDRLVNVCTDIERSNAKLIENYKTSQERESEIPQVDVCEEVIRSGTDTEVMKLAQMFQSAPLKIKMVNYCPRPLVTAQLQHMLGALTVDGLHHEYQRAKTCTILSQFQHLSTASTCRAIESEQDQAWLSHWGDSVIYRVDQQGLVKEKVCCGVKVRHMALCPETGRVWFCCWEDGTVREILDQPVTRIVTDLSPMSLCVTVDCTVVVGVAGDIRLYTKDGHTVTSNDLPCTQSAVTPHHLACCSQTGDIAVADNDGVVYDEYISGSRTGKHPHIKVMDKQLCIRFRYPDTTRWSDIHQLLRYPYDVCFDRMGDILVADWATHSVLQIDGGRGHLLRTVYTCDAAPHTISQQGGVLWVGLVGRTVRVLKHRVEHEEEDL